MYKIKLDDEGKYILTINHDNIKNCTIHMPEILRPTGGKLPSYIKKKMLFILASYKEWIVFHEYHN